MLLLHFVPFLLSLSLFLSFFVDVFLIFEVCSIEVACSKCYCEFVRACDEGVCVCVHACVFVCEIEE